MAKRLELTVPFVAQEATQTCWYACAQMITRYWKSLVPGYSTGNYIDDPDTTAAINKFNMPLMGSAATINAGVTPALGYTMWAPSGPPTADELYARLVLNGPLWYAGDNKGFNDANTGAHAVVLTGVNVEGASSYVTLHDPWPPFEGQEAALYPYDEFFAKLPPVCLMFPSPNLQLTNLLALAMRKAWGFLLMKK
jgi:hypothetical protein